MPKSDPNRLLVSATNSVVALVVKCVVTLAMLNSTS